MNVKLIRLSTGEDLIGDITGTFTSGEGGAVKHGITIENPCIVYLSQNPDNPGGPANLGMTRWMPYANNKVFEIDNKYIVTEAEPVEELAKQYDGVFGSGLILPKAGLTLVDK